MTYCFAYITTPDPETAQAIAKACVEARLAACANILPQMQSVYRWEGNIEMDNESVLILKTRTELFGALQQKVAALHPYDVPAIFATADSDRQSAVSGVVG